MSNVHKQYLQNADKHVYIFVLTEKKKDFCFPQIEGLIVPARDKNVKAEFYLECTKLRNSSRVLGSSRKTPSIVDVTVLLLIFCTPLITIHMCLQQKNDKKLIMVKCRVFTRVLIYLLHSSINYIFLAEAIQRVDYLSCQV